jgi:iron(III) transport system ATP-binding protein
MMFPLQISALEKSYNGRRIVDLRQLDLRQGELLALLGPSGCGKSTTLRLIAGLEVPEAGEIRVGGVVVSGDRTWVAPQRRRVGMVFQDYALFPHLTVAGNIAYGLPRSARKSGRVADLLELVGLAGQDDAYPRHLSGGQQQRVALARALAPEPALLLLDEPFSSLDPGLRQQLRAEVRQILRQAGTTSLLVTHDQEEALSIADRVAVMFDGSIAQVDLPSRMYHQPASAAVAEFLGDVNLVPGLSTDQGIETGLGCVALGCPLRGAVTVMVRPESLDIDECGACGVRGVVRATMFHGHDQLVTVSVDALDAPVTVRTRSTAPVAVGQAVGVSVSGSVHVIGNH